jgi:D-beta-D-heptose 7-phosphate kinase/D-beta-D-heptose 1-phosphate adenosyltransferase
MGKVLSQDELIVQAAAAKRNGARIVFTNGCFDLLHPGHIRSLERARSLGDVLVVAINSDVSVRRGKGMSRPIVPEGERAELLAALESVDYVALFDEDTPRDLIGQLLPAVLVKGADWGANEIVGREEVEAAGGRVELVPVVNDFSTTALIERARALTQNDSQRTKPVEKSVTPL